MSRLRVALAELLLELAWLVYPVSDWEGAMRFAEMRWHRRKLERDAKERQKVIEDLVKG